MLLFCRFLPSHLFDNSVDDDRLVTKIQREAVDDAKLAVPANGRRME